MNRDEWNLLVIASANRPVTPVQLQKVLFLIGQNVPEESLGRGYYRFVPYNYGPFSPSVYSDAEALAARGLVSVASSDAGYKQFSATNSGTDAAARVRNAISEDLSNYVKELTGWAQSLSFQDLVRSIYAIYPTFREKSIFRG